MIRINLLGQARPKAAKQSVPLESTLQIILGIAAVAIARPAALSEPSYRNSGFRPTIVAMPL